VRLFTLTQDFRFGAVGKSIIPLWEAVAGRLGAVGEAVYNGRLIQARSADGRGRGEHETSRAVGRRSGRVLAGPRIPRVSRVTHWAINRDALSSVYWTYAFLSQGAGAALLGGLGQRTWLIPELLEDGKRVRLVARTLHTDFIEVTDKQ
jgi:hypothetical protein